MRKHSGHWVHAAASGTMGSKPPLPAPAHPTGTGTGTGSQGQLSGTKQTLAILLAMTAFSALLMQRQVAWAETELSLIAGVRRASDNG
ncbi:MAG: hypothetical protein ABJU19_22000 [Roseobacter sp.]